MEPKVKGETVVLSILVVLTVLVEMLVGGGAKENEGVSLLVPKVKAGATAVGAVTLVLDEPTPVPKVNAGVAVIVVLVVVLILVLVVALGVAPKVKAGATVRVGTKPLLGRPKGNEREEEDKDVEVLTFPDGVGATVAPNVKAGAANVLPTPPRVLPTPPRVFPIPPRVLPTPPRDVDGITLPDKGKVPPTFSSSSLPRLFLLLSSPPADVEVGSKTASLLNAKPPLKVFVVFNPAVVTTVAVAVAGVSDLPKVKAGPEILEVVVAVGIVEPDGKENPTLSGGLEVVLVVVSVVFQGMTFGSCVESVFAPMSDVDEVEVVLLLPNETDLFVPNENPPVPRLVDKEEEEEEEEETPFTLSIPLLSPGAVVEVSGGEILVSK